MSFSPENYSPPQADVLFQVLDSVVQPRSCAYVAGPLDSGKAFYERIASGERPTAREENEGRLTAFVLDLRNRLEYPVINPGLLKIAEWSGREYSIFFLEVIRRYARECWFMNGWEYSTGASKEFVFCCRIGRPCFAETGQSLTIPEGIRLIREAADFVRGLQLDDAKLRSRAFDLDRLAH